jgi:hypothetical protein
MNGAGADEILEAIRAQAAAANIRITQHAQQEMVEENISLDETFRRLRRGRFWKIIRYTAEALAA